MKDAKKSILLVEDDETLGYLLVEYLKMNNFTMTWVKNGTAALQEIETNLFDLAILDVMLPDIDGYQLAEKFKQTNSKLPFLFLTARSLKIDVLKGFALGAVDYLKKPIDEEELVVRIKNLLSRLSPQSETLDVHKAITIGMFVLNTEKQQLVSKNNEIRKLTNRETDLLLLLALHKNELCSYKEILLNLWGKNDYFNKKSLNVFISHLRKYLQEDPSISIENVHKRGFILRLPPPV